MASVLGPCRKCGVPFVGKYCKLCHKVRCALAREKRRIPALPKPAFNLTAYKAAWYVRNRERILAKLATKYPVKRAAILAYQAVYYVKHLDSILARATRYREANLDKIAASNSARRAADPEGEVARCAAYYAANRSAIAARVAATPKSGRTAVVRRERVAAAPGAWTGEEWQAKKAEHDFCCIDCGLREGDEFPASAAPRFAGKPMRLSVGHAVPLKPKRGSGCEPGSNFISNIIPQCMPCNHKQKNRVHRSVMSRLRPTSP